MLFENPNRNVQEISNQMMIFDTQANRISLITANIVYLFLLLSGSVYFAFMGFWAHAFVCAILAVITFLLYVTITAANTISPDPDIRRTLGKTIFVAINLIHSVRCFSKSDTSSPPKMACRQMAPSGIASGRGIH